MASKAKAKPKSKKKTAERGGFLAGLLSLFGGGKKKKKAPSKKGKRDKATRASKIKRAPAPSQIRDQQWDESQTLDQASGWEDSQQTWDQGESQSWDQVQTQQWDPNQSQNWDQSGQAGWDQPMQGEEGQQPDQTEQWAQEPASQGEDAQNQAGDQKQSYAEMFGDFDWTAGGGYAQGYHEAVANYGESTPAPETLGEDDINALLGNAPPIPTAAPSAAIPPPMPTPPPPPPSNVPDNSLLFPGGVDDSLDSLFNAFEASGSMPLTPPERPAPQAPPPPTHSQAPPEALVAVAAGLDDAFQAAMGADESLPPDLSSFDQFSNEPMEMPLGDSDLMGASGDFGISGFGEAEPPVFGEAVAEMSVFEPGMGDATGLEGAFEAPRFDPPSFEDSPIATSAAQAPQFSQSAMAPQESFETGAAKPLATPQKPSPTRPGNESAPPNPKPPPTPAPPGGHEQRPEGLVSIGKMLVDQTTLKRIIDKAEHRGSGVTTTTRVISVAKGQDIDQLLGEIQRVRGVTGALVVGRDGLVISSNLPGEYDREMMGAISSSMFSNLDIQCKKMHIGALNWGMLETADGILLLASMDMGVMGVLSQGLDELDLAGVWMAISETAEKV